jgi:hypothetical protein
MLSLDCVEDASVPACFAETPRDSVAWMVERRAPKAEHETHNQWFNKGL